MEFRKRPRSNSAPARDYLCETLENRRLLTALSLVKDINTGTLGNPVTPLTRVGNIVYFEADDGINGPELYRTDGSAAGTFVLPNGFSGHNGISIENQAVAFNNKCYYISQGATNVNLSVTDGTVAGTSVVTQIDPIYDGAVSGMCVVGGKMYFVLDGDNSNNVLWVSDGTAAGTQPLSNIVPSIASVQASNITPFNATQLCFAGYTTGASQTYLTDGTAAGTRQLTTGASPAIPEFAVNGRAVIFRYGTPGTLVTTDGTTAPFQTIDTTNGILSFARNATQGYFIDGSTLYKTNGTTAGTSVVTAALTAPQPGLGMLNNGSVIFEQSTALNSGVNAVMRSDGTAAGTIQLTTFPTNGWNGLGDFGTVGNFGLFEIPTSNISVETLTTDGTAAGTKILEKAGIARFLPGGNSPAYFDSGDTVHGEELWKSDGTVAGTSMVADVDLQPAGSYPTRLQLVNGKYWFFANTQPWTTDGTAAGTKQVTADTTSFIWGESQFYTLGTKVFFTGLVPNSGHETLYWSTGTGVTPATNTSGYPYVVITPTVFNNAIYVDGLGAPGSGQQLWKTDGTTAGTVLVPGSPQLESNAKLYSANNLLYMLGADGKLYCMNTAGAFTALATFKAGVFPILNAGAAYNGKFYFIISNATSSQLWQSDGTAVGTIKVKDLGGVYAGSESIIPTTGGMFVSFGLQKFSSASKLIKSDGTAAGTNLNSGLQFNGIYEGQIYNGKLLFSSGGGLFLSDGTGAGTYQLDAPTESYYPNALSVIGNDIYFAGTDPQHGTELWRSDGVAGNAVLVDDINPGRPSSSPGAPTLIGSALYFAANDGVHNSELQMLNLANFALGTQGNDAITLTQNADHAHIDWKVGSASGEVAINDASGLIIGGGGGGSDTLTLVSTNGNPLPNNLHLYGTFTINGLTGTNPLANTNLDINAGTLFITYANATTDPINAIRGYLKNGYNNGAWTGNATAATGVIRSTSAAINAEKTSGIAYADASEGLLPLPANTIELTYTLYGDTGLSGTVGFTDFMRMTQHFTQTGQTWARGDFNYDGVVDGADFNLLQPNYGQSLPAFAPAPAITPTRPPRAPVIPPAEAVALAVAATPTAAPAKPKAGAAKRHDKKR